MVRFAGIALVQDVVGRDGLDGDAEKADGLAGGQHGAPAQAFQAGGGFHDRGLRPGHLGQGLGVQVIGMKATKGQANPALVNELLRKKLG